MDDEDFDDLLDGVELLEDSSQESLTSAAANLQFYRASSTEDLMEDLQALSTFSVDTSQCELPNLQQGDIEIGGASNLPLGDYRISIQTGSQPGLSRDHSSKYKLVRNQEEMTVLLMLCSRDAVLEKVEGVFEGIVDALLDGRNDLAITLKTRITSRSKAAALSSDSTSEPAIFKTRRICFPGKTSDEAWRFTVVIRILELMHEALRNDVVLSKRDIYYRDPALFGRQALVDRYVDDIAFTFGVSRSMLNVTAVAKGLVAGAVRFCRRDGSLVDAASERDGMLVPSLRDILSVDMTSVRWILVVEKEASFRSIAASSFWSTISTEGVIITGKGYPDIATRALLHFLSTPSPQNGFSSPPVHGLVDFDPDGLAILSVYKDGSLALSHENADLCVPQILWLGLHADHMMLRGDNVHTSQGLLSLTDRDRKKAIGMLEQCAAQEDQADGLQFQRALQRMLMLNLKAELQLLDARTDGMLELLSSKLGRS